VNARYQRLAVDGGWRRFEAPARPLTAFERRIRELDAAAARVNLTPDHVHLAAEIAALEPALDDSQRIALITLIMISLAALDNGSTRFPVTGAGAADPMRLMLAALAGEERADAVAAEIAELLKSGAASAVVGRAPDAYAPLLYLPPFICHQKVRAMEMRLGERLAARARERCDVDEAALAGAVADVRARPGVIDGALITLSDEQAGAVAAAVRSRLAVISGRPGTGKTSIILAILRVLVRLGVVPDAFALAAPTGKAAWRIGECVRGSLQSVVSRGPADDALLAQCPEPQTIHRLLGYSPDADRFRHHGNNPLAASAVIVDEGSMLDLALMERLAGAVRDEARLTVLGDADQLPSVAAGAVFRELVAAGDAGAALAQSRMVLEQGHRTRTDSAGGRALERAAAQIKAGNHALLDARDGGIPLFARRASADAVEFNAAEFLDAPDARALGAFIERWYRTVVAGDAQLTELALRTYDQTAEGFGADDCERLRTLFRALARRRLLTVTRVFRTGSQAINAQLHRMAADERGAAPIASRRYFAGEPLIVLRNDYDRMLFNGDQGVLLRVRAPGARTHHAMAVFERGANFIAFAPEALGERIELCYAMTVHKAQGSEFDAVALLLPDEGLPMLTREIVYTAITRSRRAAVIVGREAILQGAIAGSLSRFSGLGEQIAAAAARR
jgi:exodeoxyribonuclease V alpha subunit